MKDYRHSEETIQKMKSSNIGEDNPFFGKSHTEESRKSISKNKQGENHGRNKLKEKDVLEIYELLSSGSMMIKEIADMYNVASNTITQIKNGTNWKHLYHLFQN